MHNKLYYCRVCGLYHVPPPWGLDNKTPSFEICVCCGVEFGYEDTTDEMVEQYRDEWLRSGAQWLIKKKKPKD